MENFELHFKALAITIAHFIHFKLQYNFVNFRKKTAKIQTLNSY